MKKKILFQYHYNSLLFLKYYQLEVVNFIKWSFIG